MKNILLLLLISGSIVTDAQTSKFKKELRIFDKLFPNYEAKTIKQKEVIETKVWNKPATIPLFSCELVELEDGIGAMSFTIYISDNKDDYRIMLEEDINFETDIKENSEFQGEGERLLQVVFFDFNNDQFIGKPNGFPIAGLTWMPKELVLPVEHTFVESFTKSPTVKNTCVLTITEYSDMHPVKLYYIIKYHKKKLYSSEPLRGFLDEIYEKNNQLWCKYYEDYIQAETDPDKYYEKVLIDGWE